MFRWNPRALRPPKAKSTCCCCRLGDRARRSWVRCSASTRLSSTSWSQLGTCGAPPPEWGCASFGWLCETSSTGCSSATSPWWTPTCQSSATCRRSSCGVTVGRCVRRRPVPSRPAASSATNRSATKAVIPTASRRWRTPATPIVTWC